MRGKFLGKDTAFLDDMFPKVRFNPSAATGIATQPVLQQFMPANLFSSFRENVTNAGYSGGGGGPWAGRLSKSF